MIYPGFNHITDGSMCGDSNSNVWRFSWNIELFGGPAEIEIEAEWTPPTIDYTRRNGTTPGHWSILAWWICEINGTHCEQSLPVDPWKCFLLEIVNLITEELKRRAES